jgi:hypothetical protein
MRAAVAGLNSLVIATFLTLGTWVFADSPTLETAKQYAASHSQERTIPAHERLVNFDTQNRWDKVFYSSGERNLDYLIPLTLELMKDSWNKAGAVISHDKPVIDLGETSYEAFLSSNAQMEKINTYSFRQSIVSAARRRVILLIGELLRSNRNKDAEQLLSEMNSWLSGDPALVSHEKLENALSYNLRGRKRTAVGGLATVNDPHVDDVPGWVPLAFEISDPNFEALAKAASNLADLNKRMQSNPADSLVHAQIQLAKNYYDLVDTMAKAGALYRRKN